MDTYMAANAELSKFSRNYMELKKNLPIRPSEMGVLNILTETPGPHTPAGIAELLGVSKPMITAHLNALLKKGYVHKQQSPEDKRVFYVVPTAQGRTLAADAKADTRALLEQLARHMGHREFDMLVQLIACANGYLSAQRSAMVKEEY